jgi:hypothetical protein
VRSLAESQEITASTRIWPREVNLVTTNQPELPESRNNHINRSAYSSGFDKPRRGQVSLQTSPAAEGVEESLLIFARNSHYFKSVCCKRCRLHGPAGNPIESAIYLDGIEVLGVPGKEISRLAVVRAEPANPPVGRPTRGSQEKPRVIHTESLARRPSGSSTGQLGSFWRQLETAGAVDE